MSQPAQGMPLARCHFPLTTQQFIAALQGFMQTAPFTGRSSVSWTSIIESQWRHAVAAWPWIQDSIESLWGFNSSTAVNDWSFQVKEYWQEQSSPTGKSSTIRDDEVLIEHQGPSLLLSVLAPPQSLMPGKNGRCSRGSSMTLPTTTTHFKEVMPTVYRPSPDGLL